MPVKRNVLIIVQNLPVPFDRRVWLEAVSLRRAGLGVAVICPKKKIYTKSFEQIEGVDIYRYPLIYEAAGGVLGYFVEFVYCWLASLRLAFTAYLHRPFQVIHACNPPDTFFLLALLFRPMGVKFVFDHHDLCPEMYLAKGHCNRGLLYRGLLGLERLTLRTADAVISVNQSHREIAMQRGGIVASRVSIVRSGPPRAWADIQASRLELKLGRKYLVVYVGEMCEQDGVDYLLRAIRNYANICPKDTLFTLIGGGPEQHRLKQASQQLHLDEWVEFTGRVSDQRLWQYLATADLCIDPDPFTEWSNMSTMNKMIEYLAFGKPVVAFDLTEHRRTAGDAAVYVEPNDIVKLADVTRKLLLDEEWRRTIGRLAQRRFRTQLAWESSEEELLALYWRLFSPERRREAIPSNALT